MDMVSVRYLPDVFSFHSVNIASYDSPNDWFIPVLPVGRTGGSCRCWKWMLHCFSRSPDKRPAGRFDL
jgi:hypothetical protein